jgi:hypothetical protein
MKHIHMRFTMADVRETMQIKRWMMDELENERGRDVWKTSKDINYLFLFSSEIESISFSLIVNCIEKRYHS